MLPRGWYPEEARELEAKLGAWDRVDEKNRPSGALAGIAPHAGWYFSGRIAWAAWGAAANADAVVIVGGHLPAGADFRYYPEDGFYTALGVIAAATELRDRLVLATAALPDRNADNTVEVHLPMAAYRFPGKPVVCLRAPADVRAAGLGRALSDYVAETGRRVFMLASTDLCHYGRNYGFEPAGPGPGGFSWARKADRAIIDAFLAMDQAETLKRAHDEGSACSAGAVIAAMAYARAVGATQSHLLMRGSSDETAPGSDSSVGYCSVAYVPGA